MRVWIESVGKWIDANDELIILQLNDADKENIGNMPSENKFMGIFPFEERGDAEHVKKQNLFRKIVRKEKDEQGL